MNCSFNIRYKPRTTRAFTKSVLTVYDSADNTALNALTVYGKSEVVDGSIKSAGEGYAVVRLADLTWDYRGEVATGLFSADFILPAISAYEHNIICVIYPYSGSVTGAVEAGNKDDKSLTIYIPGTRIFIKDTDYTTVSDFVASLGDAELVYELADPTQGNTIAIKTDNDSGINGTMAVFSTGTPLRGIPDTDVRDVMAWNGSAGTVTKNCGEAEDLGSFDFTRFKFGDVYYFRSPNIITIVKTVADTQIANIYMPSYEPVAVNDLIRNAPNHTLGIDIQGYLYIRTDEIDNVTDFKTAMNGVKLVYELANPTTEQLTSTENASLAGLKTFTPQTHAQNNVQTDMTVDYTIRVPTI